MARRRLSHKIVIDYLRSIGSGGLPEGAAMPTESMLCEEYQVGRSVVREALQALDAKGFIIVRQGSVAAVAPRQHWNVLDSDFLNTHSGEEFFAELQTAREVLEPQIAYLAAANARDSDLRLLEEAHLGVTSQKANPHQHAQADIGFHRSLALAAGNSVLSSFHDSLTSLGERTRLASAAVPGAIDRAHAWHQEILDAVRAGDSDCAAAAMRLHLRQVRGELLELDALRQLDH